ncbi:META domain-containing protein [Chloroflexota bacterium]
MNKVKILLAILLLTSVIGLVACRSEASIEDTAWRLELYDEKGDLKAPLVEDTEITIEFRSTESKFGGSGGCNNYFGSYEITKNELTIKPPIGSTMMACTESIMNQEQEYFKLLETTETFKMDDNKLTITCSGNKELVFVKGN